MVHIFCLFWGAVHWSQSLIHSGKCFSQRLILGISSSVTLALESPVYVASPPQQANCSLEYTTSHHSVELGREKKELLCLCINLFWEARRACEGCGLHEKGPPLIFLIVWFGFLRLGQGPDGPHCGVQASLELPAILLPAPSKLWDYWRALQRTSLCFSSLALWI